MMKLAIASFISSLIAPYLITRNPRISLAIAIVDTMVTVFIYSML
jgi:uncharacterized membrane protein